MPQFKVTAENPVPLDRIFHPNLPNMPYGTRHWTVEAKDEAEVRRHWDEAQRENLLPVRGFTLKSVEAV